MSQKRLSGFTAALMVSTLGFVPVSRADQTEVVATRANTGLTVDAPLSPNTSATAVDPQAYWGTPQHNAGANRVTQPSQRELNQPGATAVKVGASQSADQQFVPSAAPMAQVVPHAFDQYQAATLYLRGIPVITFLDPNPRNPLNPTRKLPSSAKAPEQLGSGAVDKAIHLAPEQSPSRSPSQSPSRSSNPVTASSNGPESSPSAPDDRTVSSLDEQSDPVLRATRVAALLNYLHQTGLEASAVQVRWDTNHETYQVYLDTPGLTLPTFDTGSEAGPIAANGENPAAPTAPVATVVAIDQYTISPDTTGDLAEDALQVANRLRRLLGNASPLTSVERPDAPAYRVRQAQVQQVIQGMASWYGPGFHGRRSANGEVYNQNAMTAAHRSLPFGTQVRVTNLQTGKSVVVRINDRGPYTGNRVIDLSAAAAQYLGMIHSGIAPVRLDILE